jgi:hypothetical protein
VDLTERLRRDGRTADTVAAWIRARLGIVVQDPAQCVRGG